MLMKHKPGLRNSALSAREREQAEALSISALSFLASEEARLFAFLDATGLDPGSLREAASSPGFLLAVLEHVAADESLLLAFTANENIDPSAILRAREKLAGPLPDGLREG
jgi:hypothetical protein